MLDSDTLNFNEDFNEVGTLFAEVILPLPLPKIYTYRIPREWNELVFVGQRVAVQFGARKVYAAIIYKFSDVPPQKYQASYILDILDTVPLVSNKQLEFWEWMARYYMCYLGDVMNAALPAGFKLESTCRIVLNPDFDDTEEIELDENEWLIIELLQKNKSLKIEEINEKLHRKNSIKYINSLYTRGLLRIEEEIKEKYVAKTEWFLKPASVFFENDALAAELLNKLEKKAPVQADVLMALLANGNKEISQKSLLVKYPDLSTVAINALVKKELIIKEKISIDRLAKTNISQNLDFELTPAQYEVTLGIKNAFISNKKALLYGVTGSGKTFVYLKLIKDFIEQGKQVLYLIPEVGLTEFLVQKFELYFGNKMAVWHHYYTSNERTEIYNKIKSNDIKLLVGTRSAIFAPFVDLGLIVVDEEHENSYKQFDKRPKFHARDSALKLAQIFKANILLGSATPSYESYLISKSDTGELFSLDKRFADAQFPTIELVHMGEAKKNKQVRNAFSEHLLKAIENSLSKQEQVIIYQNRKGYVPFVSCNMCGFTAHCPNCDITLTHYKHINANKCTYCGHTEEPFGKCPACGSADITMRGFGTERITEELNILFPEAKIARFDNDAIRKRGDFQKIWNGFANKEIDILVGTQLLSKGVDFANVSLVGVVDADILLKKPDFRSHEVAFQQLLQVSGRAGRGQKQGLVIVQTHQFQHPVLAALLNQEYMELNNLEIPIRKLYNYPPFGRIIILLLKHKDEHRVKLGANYFNTLIKKALGDRLLGPQPPSISRIRNMYLRQFMIKLNPEKDNISKIKLFIHDAIEEFHKHTDFKTVLVDIDVDPA